MNSQTVSKIIIWTMLIVGFGHAVGSAAFQKKPVTKDYLEKHVASNEQEVLNIAAAYSKEWLTWNPNEKKEDRQKRLAVFSFPVSDGVELKKDQYQNVSGVYPLKLNNLSNGIYSVDIFASTNTAVGGRFLKAKVLVKRNSQGYLSILSQPSIYMIKQVAKEDLKLGQANMQIPENLKSMLDSFFRGYTSVKTQDELANFLIPQAKVLPLEGVLNFQRITSMQLYGNNPYTAKVEIQCQDKFTGVILKMEYLIEIVKNDKYYIKSINP